MDELARVDALAEALVARVGRAPRAFVLGSGVAGTLPGGDRSVAFADLPGLPVPTVAGHGGEVRRVALGAAEALVVTGRVHAYEGHDAHTVVRLARALVRLGVRELVLTNASGGIRPDLGPGTLVCLTDHLNLTGLDPGVGLSDGPLGPRFPDLTAVYDRTLRTVISGAAARASVPLAEGVYAGRLGPSYETPAEVRMLAGLGADVVGMSTVLEAIAAHRMGARVAAISCVTNRAAGTGPGPLDHAEVLREGRALGGRLAALLAALPEVT